MAEGTKNGASRVLLYLSIAIAGMSILGPLGVGLYWISKLEDRVTQLEKLSPSNDTAFTELKSRMNRIDDQIGDMRGQILQLVTSQNEVETQFCDTGNTLNLMHAFDLRVEGMMFEKVFSTRFPTDNAFYPILCRRQRQ